MRWCAALGAALMLAGRTSSAQGAPLPSSVLAVRDARGEWREFWSSESAPTIWRSAPLAAALTWRAGAVGVVWSEVQLKGSGEAWRAVLAVNAGQFAATMPWGWVVLHGRRWLPPQHGPLSAALVQDSSGTLRWVRGPDVQSASLEQGVRWAFQSYPAVLANDSVLPPLRAGGLGVDVGHRDARAGICLTRDEQLLVAITRFDGVGPALHFVPFGLTAPEMAGVLGALGCRDAMLLDGGISARLRVRDARGVAHDWEGLRSVPLGLVAWPR